MNEARIGVQQAAADIVSQRNAVAEHEVKRRAILDACSCAERGAALWRLALHRHDAGKSALVSALAVACRAEENAQKRVVSALRDLQREMRGLDYAREQVRGLVAAQQEDSDPDD
ncbi:hypothetical protein [Paraburkholderia adhaesiva]|uniref:hypothetical protein n=1 Tax=Paraburkholderia adhaesiva TaxID=2883244 RepID=UPI001F16A7AB|nr:hypothetical protein [Paraburkholderia adhaesiva]